MIALFLLLFAFLAARGLSFLRDWSPFVLLLLGYAALTGIAPGLTGVVHVGFPIQADRWLFRGAEPNLWLQSHLFHPGHPQWYDYVATFLYPMHFVTPLVLAFVLWMWWKPRYWRFVTAYLLLCYAAFATYLLYPMAPPWWAYRVGKLPPVHLVLYEVHYDGVQNPIVLRHPVLQAEPRGGDAQPARRRAGADLADAVADLAALGLGRDRLSRGDGPHRRLPRRTLRHRRYRRRRLRARRLRPGLWLRGAALAADHAAYPAWPHAGPGATGRRHHLAAARLPPLRPAGRDPRRLHSAPPVRCHWRG